MKIKIITGYSGGGKSSLLEAFEDMGYYCVDNMPPNLLLQFIELYTNSSQPKCGLLFVMDLRLGEFFKEIDNTIIKLKNEGYDVELIFVSASKKELINRYKGTRRKHPNDINNNISEAIDIEIKLMEDIRQKADEFVDTTNLNVHQLKTKIKNRYKSTKHDDFIVVLNSFGFKYGTDIEADYIFDLRILKNPFYNDNLKEKTGLDEEVRDYILKEELSQLYFEKIYSLIELVCKTHKADGRYDVKISFGCTGGKHRSVTFAYLVNQKLKDKYDTVLEHRDLR